jgi:outer membrane receptor protein involved in Fe transport
MMFYQTIRERNTPSLPGVALSNACRWLGILSLTLLSIDVCAAADTAATGDTGVTGTAPDAAADDSGSLEKLVVRNKRPAVTALADQKDVPKSVTIVSGQELEALDALNVTEIFQRLGNIQWNFGNPMTGSLSIRGVTNPATGTTIDPSLGLVIDGVTYNFIPLITQADFVDVATVSVTRGPQGSTGGENNSLGTITVTSNIPTFQTEAHASLTLGELNSVIAQGAYGGAVIDDLLAWRATFYRDQEQGPYNNAFFGNKNRYSWGNQDRTLGRVQFLLTPTEKLNVLTSFTLKPKGIEFTNGLTQQVQQPYYYANGAPTYIPNGQPGATNLPENKFNRGYFTNITANAYQQYLSTPVLEATDQGIQNGEYGGFVKINYDLDWATVQSVSAYENSFFEASNGTTAWNISTDGGVYARYNQLSEEASISSKPGGFVDYKTGVFFLNSRAFQDSRALYGADAGAYDANSAQYASLSTSSAGLQLLENSLYDAYTESPSWAVNRTAALFGSLDWHLTTPLTLTTGLRITNEDRRTTQAKEVTIDGAGSNLDPAGYGEGFITTSTGALGAGNSAAQIGYANSLAQQYFGVASYSALNAAQLKQVYNAQQVRLGNIYNQLYAPYAAQPYKGNLPSGNVALSYKITPDVTSYLSWQHGVKAGISQVSGVDKLGNPISRLVAPEKSNDYELGLKGGYLQNTLIVNADIYYDLVNNYQQSVTILDPVLTAQNNNIAQYTSITGNAPQIELSGLEVDAVYTGIRHLTLRFAGDYSHAFYSKDVLTANPVEDGNLSPAYHDAKGQTLYDAPRFSYNFSGEYSIPVFKSNVFHTNFNWHYTSSENSDQANSAYAVVPGYGLANLGIGLGRRDRKFDVNLIVKNVFNRSYIESQTWASYIPGAPRWWGIAFSTTL